MKVFGSRKVRNLERANRDLRSALEAALLSTRDVRELEDSAAVLQALASLISPHQDHPSTMAQGYANQLRGNADSLLAVARRHPDAGQHPEWHEAGVHEHRSELRRYFAREGPTTGA